LTSGAVSLYVSRLRDIERFRMVCIFKTAKDL
jgi:hypothetical protein